MPITEVLVRPDVRRRRFFPYPLQRFRGLRGALTGDVALVARSRRVLEVQLGDDWVQFERRDVLELMVAIFGFLSFDDEFRERIMKLEISPEERERLEALIEAFSRSDDAREGRRAEARVRREEAADEEADETVTPPPAVEAAHKASARRPRRRSN